MSAITSLNVPDSKNPILALEEHLKTSPLNPSTTIEVKVEQLKTNWQLTIEPANSKAIANYVFEDKMIKPVLCCTTLLGSNITISVKKSTEAVFKNQAFSYFRAKQNEAVLEHDKLKETIAKTEDQLSKRQQNLENLNKFINLLKEEIGTSPRSIDELQADYDSSCKELVDLISKKENINLDTQASLESKINKLSTEINRLSDLTDELKASYKDKPFAEMHIELLTERLTHLKKELKEAPNKLESSLKSLNNMKLVVSGHTPLTPETDITEDLEDYPTAIPLQPTA